MHRPSDWHISPFKPFGVEIVCDLSLGVDAEGAQKLRDLYDQHKLLLFRHQALDEAQHAETIAIFDRVLTARGEFREISSDGNLGMGPLAFHSDLAFTDEPFRLISLHAKEVTDGQSWTAFANGAAAARRLFPDRREHLKQAEALTVISVIQSHREVAFDPPAFLPQQRRPAIIAHPRTGEDILYISEMQTARIEGLPQAESDGLLAELFDALYDDAHVYRHHWNNGDLLIWDNIALQHARCDLTGMIPRRLQRIVGADHSFFDLCPQFDLEDPRVAAWGSGDTLVVAE